MSRWRPDAPERLMAAAIVLFGEQGYDESTVSEIAERAGLTKRTFFRHFADKREVLFSGSDELERRWVDAVAAAPAGATPLDAVTAGFDGVADLFEELHAAAAQRARIIAATSELQERELIKLQTLGGALAETLRARGVSDGEATFAAQLGVTVFHVAFGRWVAQDDPAVFRGLLDESLRELREVAAA